MQGECHGAPGAYLGEEGVGHLKADKKMPSEARMLTRTVFNRTIWATLGEEGVGHLKACGAGHVGQGRQAHVARRCGPSGSRAAQVRVMRNPRTFGLSFYISIFCRLGAAMKVPSGARRGHVE